MTEIDGYFEWLCGLVAPVDGVTGHFYYHRLFQLLYKKIFYAMHDRDENRAEDALVLRSEFETVVRTDISSEFVPKGRATVLEVIIALARKISRDMDGVVYENSTGRWFWEMIDNLKLSSYDDVQLERRTDQEYLVDDIIERFLSRKYSVTGVGGLFPLWRNGTNQRELEIWDQCQQYLYERYVKDILN